VNKNNGIHLNFIGMLFALHAKIIPIASLETMNHRNHTLGKTRWFKLNKKAVGITNNSVYQLLSVGKAIRRALVILCKCVIGVTK
jgi:hypothetical protein